MDKSMKSLITLLAFCLTGSVWASDGFNFFHELEHTFHVPAHSISLFVAMIVFLVLGIAYRSKLSNVQNTVIPDSGISLRNIIEFLGQMMMNSARSVMGEESAKKYYSYIVFVFTFILFTNVMGLIPGSLTPNENLNTTLALGLFTFIYFNIQGIRAVGFINYMKHFMGPLLPLAPLIFCIEIISICIRPVSLAFRCLRYYWDMRFYNNGYTYKKTDNGFVLSIVNDLFVPHTSVPVVSFTQHVH
jgi:F-type H+-transporting ATPase subunit a